MLSLPFCRDDSARDVTYELAEHYQGFSSLAYPWGLISIGGSVLLFYAGNTMSEIANIFHSPLTFL